MNETEAPIPDPSWGAKLALRDQLLTTRRRIPPAELGARALAVAAIALAQSEVRLAATVAAYVSVGHEPGTGPLLDALTGAGKRVILPILLPDLDLDWAAYTGASSLVSAGRGLLEPAGTRLGVEALGTADLVIVPGLAVDRSGMRLGRGGGSYDRALTRATGPVWCLLNADEVLEVVPSGQHDRRVHAALTPDGMNRFHRAR
ncbi:MAG TPA: 5-formyltetrahydrofolate cyclo-ligase [Marmoricola sp.]